MNIVEFNNLSSEEQIDKILEASKRLEPLVIEEANDDLEINFNTLIKEDGISSDHLSDDFIKKLNYAYEDFKIYEKQVTLKVNRYKTENNIEFPTNFEGLKNTVNEICKKINVDINVYNSMGMLEYVRKTVEPKNLSELCILCYYIGTKQK